MADFVTEKTMIAASPDEIMSVLRDFPRYPEWARDLKAVEVLGMDEEGRGRDVRFRAAAMGRQHELHLALRPLGSWPAVVEAHRR